MSKLIAVDPGGTVGVAVLEGQQLVDAASFKWPDKRDKFKDFMLDWIAPGTRVLIEDPKGCVWGYERMSPKERAGREKRLRLLRERFGYLCALIEMLGGEIVKVRPVRGGTKWPRHKWDAVFPEGAGRKISSHARDAAVLGMLNCARWPETKR